MRNKTGILWFRLDLRLHDNEALTEALRYCDTIVPVYVFDERLFRGKTQRFDFPKTDKYRAKFIIESVENLRSSLRRLGSDLIVRVGKPEEEVFNLARSCHSTWVFCNRERTPEEERVQDILERHLWSVGQEMRYSRGKLLYYTADLPYPITQTPDTFTQFRKETERVVDIREPLPRPEVMPPLFQGIDAGAIPTLESLGHEQFQEDDRAALPFKGGETEGLNRLNYYLWESDLAHTYIETRNELIGGDYSTKFSPWMAQGCLSPKMIYHELKRYEQERGESKSTYLIFYGLLWRDFFRLIAKKHKAKLFQEGGIQQRTDLHFSTDLDLLQKWIDGKTGVPFIDANMRELKLTGFMSDRGRLNVASYLVNDLKLDWQMGAEYFESIIIDYDVASNWGNWNYIAGLSNDPREVRYLNPVTQARRYDAQGDYIRRWLPELQDLSPAGI